MTVAANLTPALVRAYWQHMHGLYGTRVVPKASSGFMSATGALLGALGVLDKQSFMSRYTTTVGSTIYTPFEIGGTDRSLAGQVELGAHEHQHVVVRNRLGAVKYDVAYVVDHAARTEIEVECYTTSLEVNHMLNCFDSLETLQQQARTFAGLLRDYGCNAEDVLVAEVCLLGAVESVFEGGVVTEVGLETAAWLRRANLLQ